MLAEARLSKYASARDHHCGGQILEICPGTSLTQNATFLEFIENHVIFFVVR